MNTVTRSALDATPIPVEDGYAVRACVVGADSGCRTAWCHDGGRHKEPFGPLYSNAKDAAAASRYLNERSRA